MSFISLTFIWKYKYPLSCNILSYPMWTWVCLYVSWWIHPGRKFNKQVVFLFNYCPCLTCLIVSRSLNSYKVPDPVEALNPALNSLKVELSPILSTVKTLNLVLNLVKAPNLVLNPVKALNLVLNPGKAVHSVEVN